MSDGGDLAARARGIYAAAVAAADPAAFVRSALAGALAPNAPDARRWHWIIAIGKAAPAMAGAAVAMCAAGSRAVAGGLVVGAAEVARVDAGLEYLAGDHPVPGARSARAAAALAALCDEVGDDDEALVLVSGGASSLVGAPVAGVPFADLATLNAMLLSSGIDIVHMNIARKRFSCWGAGRLAAALAPAIVRPILLSDVPGDELAAIGSGPCAPDPTTAGEVEAILRHAGIARRLPLSIASHLGAVRAGVLPETPKAGSQVFTHVRRSVVGGNQAALTAAARCATGMRIGRVVVDERPLTGDAADAGRAIARAALAAEAGTCVVLGGETTVTLPGPHGTGGRNQQLALAAAEVLHLAGHAAPPVVILAAGTDGRDGPTDAAGALVMNDTWSRIRGAGLDPGAHLARCDAYPALDAARALERTGPTGTNVADIVVALTG